MRSLGLRLGTGLVMVAALLVSAEAGAGPPTSPDGAWRRAEPPPDAKGDLALRDGSYAVFALDQERLSAALARVPVEGADGEDTYGEPTWLPMPDGTFVSVAAVESPVMEPELARQFPDIRTYRAQGTEDRALSVRFDRGPLGLRAILLFPQRTVYIAP